jgi:predicted RNA binding protein YcfA (HicA-like mRNA interferase family)
LHPHEVARHRSASLLSWGVYVKRAAKTLEAMRAYALNWRIEDLEAVARAVGISIRRPGGSHVYFTHPRIREGVSVPARRPIKPPYVRAFVRFVDRVRQA